MEIKENGLTHRILSDGKEILLLGTAHVSKESAHLVQSVIETEKPDTVAVELCESRYQAITQRKKWEETDIFKVIREKKTGLLMLNLLLASFQKRVANKLGVRPGEEMLSAIKTAESVGARIHLADRNIRTTLMRVWHAMGTWDKLRLLFRVT